MFTPNRFFSTKKNPRHQIYPKRRKGEETCWLPFFQRKDLWGCWIDLEFLRVSLTENPSFHGFSCFHSPISIRFAFCVVWETSSSTKQVIVSSLCFLQNDMLSLFSSHLAPLALSWIVCARREFIFSVIPLPLLTSHLAYLAVLLRQGTTYPLAWAETKTLSSTMYPTSTDTLHYPHPFTHPPHTLTQNLFSQKLSLSLIRQESEPHACIPQG